MAVDETAFHSRIRMQLLPLSLAAALALPATTISFASDARDSMRATKPLATCDDAGLRAAIAGASSGDVLDLTACSAITLTAGEIHVNVDDLTLNGPGADHLTIDGDASDYYFHRIFDHTRFGTLSINDMTLADAHYIGFAPGAIVKGGCVYSAGSVSLSGAVITGCMVDTITADYALGGGVYALGDLTLDHSVVSLNTAFAPSNEAEGGGVFVRGNLRATDSWIHGNAVIAPTSYGKGGGLVVLGSGNVDIVRSTLSWNSADFSGGAYVNTSGSIEVVNSTISSNAASRYVGGASLLPAATLANSTVTSNLAENANFGAGIYAFDLTVQSSIVANNRDAAQTTMLDIFAGSIHGSDSLITSASSPVPDGTVVACPRLKPLQDNGGPTPTHKLIAGSPAIDEGNNAIPLATDQRSMGFARTFGTKTDIGAYEWQGEADETIFKSAFEVPCDDY